MKTTSARRRVIVGCFVVTLAAFAVYAFWRDPYSWLTTRQWLSMLPSGGFRADHAVIAIRRTPKDKLFPIIREWMSTTNTFPSDGYDLLSKLSIVPTLSTDRRRVAAYQAIAILGPEAKPFVPDLKAVLLGPPSPSTFDAAFALLVIGSEGQAIIAGITTADNEKAQIAKAATADMLTQRAVNAALQAWTTQTAYQVNRLRSIFNLKCAMANFRMQMASNPPPWRTNSMTNSFRRGRLP